MLSEGLVPVPFTPAVSHPAHALMLQLQTSYIFLPYAACVIVHQELRTLVCALPFEHILDSTDAIPQTCMRFRSVCDWQTQP